MPSRSKTQSLAPESVEPTEAMDMDDAEERREEWKEKKEEKEGRKAGWAAGWGGGWGKDKDGRPRGWGYASMYLWFIVAPIVLWIILFTVKPGFVTDNLNGVVVVNNQKLLLWTLIFSIVAWILIYACYYCKY
jgi:hypothetical protein